MIDALTHILPPYFSDHRAEAIKRDTTFRDLFSNPRAKIVGIHDLLSEMDRSGIDKSVIAGFGWVDSELAIRSNDYNLECASKHSDRIIAACSVDPLWDGEAAAKEADRCLRAGAAAIGELHADTQEWVEPPYDRFAGLAETARRYGAPIIIHASEPVGHLYAGKGTMTPVRLVELAQTFPENRFVFSHLGGGLPFYEQMPEVARELSNAFYDSAAAPFLYNSNVYRSMIASGNVRKTMFASDFPVVGQQKALDHLEAADLDEDASEKILCLNAQEVFRLSDEARD